MKLVLMIIKVVAACLESYGNKFGDFSLYTSWIHLENKQSTHGLQVFISRKHLMVAKKKSLEV